MNNITKYFLNEALSMMEDHRLHRNQKHRELIQEWEDSKKLPRKKKKEKRKDIILTWNILSYDPFYIDIDDEEFIMMKNFLFEKSRGY